MDGQQRADLNPTRGQKGREQEEAQAHELSVTLTVLGSIQDYDRVQVRDVPQPQIESAGACGFRQALMRRLRGETREDTVQRLRDVVCEAERSQDAAVVRECAEAAAGLERLRTTYKDDARVSAELSLLARRLREKGGK